MIYKYWLFQVLQFRVSLFINNLKFCHLFVDIFCLLNLYFLWRKMTSMLHTSDACSRTAEYGGGTRRMLVRTLLPVCVCIIPSHLHVNIRSFIILYFLFLDFILCWIMLMTDNVLNVQVCKRWYKWLYCFFLFNIIHLQYNYIVQTWSCIWWCWPNK